MGRYISLPITVEGSELTDQARDALQALIPGWEPSPGNLDDWILQTTSRLAADLREFASDVPEEIFQYFGQEVLLVFPRVASYASFESTWTAVDDAGYTIPAGTVIGVRTPDGDLAAFQTVQIYEIPAASTTVSDVVAVAIEAGEGPSGLTTDEVTVVDALSWVQSIVGDTPTTGGVDGETTDEYMDRLVDEIRLMSPRPIIPQDFAVLVRRIPGIDRGYPVNLYNADTDTEDVEKAITVVVTDEDGEVVSAQTKADALALLESMREVNMLVFVEDPQYQEVDIDYELTAMPNVDPVALKVAVDEAIEEYISPKTWGEIRQGTEDLNLFRPVNTVRYLEVATVINNVDGVDYIETLTLDAGTANVTLDPGAGVPVVLPRAIIVSGVVNEPT